MLAIFRWSAFFEFDHSDLYFYAAKLAKFIHRHIHS